MLPRGFLWGASTAAHQVEGGNDNNWTVWETANCERLAATALPRLRQQSAFGFSSKHADRFAPQISNPANYISGRSSDHYHRFRGDFDLAQKLNHTAHRFSIEWSRVEPEPGRFDEQKFSHYAEVIRGLKSRGLEPVVTLWHWALPVWFSRRRGFESKESPELFARFVQQVAQRFQADVTYWLPSMSRPYTRVRRILRDFFRRIKRI